MTKKTKSIKKSISKELSKPLTKDEVKQRLWRAVYYDEHPDSIYNKLWELLTKSNIKEWSKEETDYINKHVRSIDNFSKSHVWLAETQEEWNLRTTIIEFTNNLIEEYNCITTLEKSLCEVIWNSYWKVMQISKKITNCILAWEYISDNRTRYLSMLWKELDRANRNYIMSLNNLLEIKRPQMNINIKTKNAYIWQNQQFNNNIIEDENIKD